MLRTVSLIALLAMPLSSCSKPEPPVWQGLRWGMSEDDVKSALSGVTEYSIYFYGQHSLRLGLPHYDIDQCKGEVVLSFDDYHHLSAIGIVFAPPTDDAMEDCRDTLKDALLIKYGSPVYSKGGDSLRASQTVWATPNSQIVLMLAASVSGGPPLSVNYFPREHGTPGRL